MGYYLVTNRTGQYIQLPNPISVNYGTDAYTIEIKCAMLDTSNNNTLLGQSVTTSTTDNNISFTTSGRLQIAAGGSNAYFTSANFGLFDGLPHVYRLEHDAGGAWRAYRDGDLFQSGSYSTSRTGTNPLSRLFRQSTTSTTSSWDFYYLTITGFSVNDTWDANLSGGTGSILPSLSGSNNGTQQGTWPADDSEWVFYSTGGGTVDASAAYDIGAIDYAATSTVTAPNITAALSYDIGAIDYAASSTVTVAGNAASASFDIGEINYSAAATVGVSSSAAYSIGDITYNASALASVTASAAYDIGSVEFTASASVVGDVSAAIGYDIGSVSFSVLMSVPTGEPERSLTTVNNPSWRDSIFFKQFRRH